MFSVHMCFFFFPLQKKNSLLPARTYRLIKKVYHHQLNCTVQLNSMFEQTRARGSNYTRENTLEIGDGRLISAGQRLLPPSTSSSSISSSSLVQCSVTVASVAKITTLFPKKSCCLSFLMYSKRHRSGRLESSDDGAIVIVVNAVWMRPCVCVCVYCYDYSRLNTPHQ